MSSNFQGEYFDTELVMQTNISSRYFRFSQWTAEQSDPFYCAISQGILFPFESEQDTLGFPFQMASNSSYVHYHWNLSFVRSSERLTTLHFTQYGSGQ